MTQVKPSSEHNESLDLIQLASSLKRRWIYILLGVLLGGSYGVYRTARSNPVWQGSFQIVIAEKDGGGTSFGGSGVNILANLAGLSRGGKTELATQVKVLESPSVLKDVFQNIKARKERKGDNLQNYKFSDWSKNLSVSTEKGTSILLITYSDTQKDQIVPTLQDISNIYQMYSNRDRNEALVNSIAYAEEQAKKYKRLADSSFRALNAYGMTYGIATNRSSAASVGSGIDASKLLGNNQSSTGPAVDIRNQSTNLLPQSGALDQLAKVNQELVRLRLIFTDKDPSVIALENERKALRMYLESSAVGNIAYTGRSALDKKEAQNVLLKYKELERKASRDQSTLDTMESTLLSLKLEQSRSTKPWELISTPTVSEAPISPLPLKNLIYGLAGGLVLGSLAALISDRASGLIFNVEELTRNLSCPLIGVLTCENRLQVSEFVRLLQVRIDSNKSLAVISIGDVSKLTLDTLSQSLESSGFRNVKMSNALVDACSSLQTVLIAEAGSVKRSDIQMLSSELNLLNSDVMGLIWFKKSF